MIRIAFFDVGETLIHGSQNQPFPGVVAALRAIAGFKTIDNQPLVLGIISDYHMPNPPPSEAQILALEEQYRNQVLAPSGLTDFFLPFDSRVTISTRARHSKPAKEIFEAALERSGAGATLAECLFVTENLTHLKESAKHKITPVRFGPGPATMAGFEDWADAPAVIAELVAPGQAGNLAAALAPALAARHGFVGFTMKGASGRTVRGRTTQLMKLDDARLGPLDGVYVERPVDLTVGLSPDGRVASAKAEGPEPDEVADAVNFVSSLVKSGKVAIPGQPAPKFGATHAVEVDEAGRRRLVRRGYSAR